MHRTTRPLIHRCLGTPQVNVSGDISPLSSHSWASWDMLMMLAVLCRAGAGIYDLNQKPTRKENHSDMHRHAWTNGYSSWEPSMTNYGRSPFLAHSLPDCSQSFVRCNQKANTVASRAVNRFTNSGRALRGCSDWACSSSDTRSSSGPWR